ncbi:hypothetical protein G195_000317 [Phytophthora kernoviae 00238/432]|uniref:Cytochrome P450 n=1 Tax=Phytophthora kernoviae 00238/432 TaxID=1284355 RepID=A0A8J4SWL8_9STRA|nr:hypothetical protein G195_000317 [Phytophthora kernoviae 00238/432]
MESLRPRVQQIADELLDQVQAQGEMDLVKDYAYPLPIHVISDMLGVPKSDRPQIQNWSSAIAHGLGLGVRDPGVEEHLRAFGDYTAQLVAEKRKHPADDLISQLIAIEEEGDRLSEPELLSMITLLIFAGHETTSNLIATGAMMLLDHPEQLEKLKADLSLAPSAVEELLRFNGPATIAGPRFATQDIELAGQRIKKGDMVIPVLKSANRDELQFEQPEDLDVTRDIQVYEVDMPIGHYSDCEVSPTCGMANGEGMIIREDEPASFFHPKHVGAQIIGGSNEAGDSGSGDGKVTLSFWTLFDGGDGANMQTLVDEFNKTHPDIEDEDSAKRKAAMIFADWVADNGQVWAKAGHIPSKPSVLEKQEFKDLPYRSDYSEVASVVKFSKHSTKNAQIRDEAAFKFLNEVWMNKMTPADAMNNMETAIQKILSE